MDDFNAQAIAQSLRTRFMARELHFFDTIPTTQYLAVQKQL